MNQQCRRFLCLSLFLGALTSVAPEHAPGQEKKPDPGSAEAILKKVAQTYREAKSYRDSGVLTQVIHNKFKSTRRSTFEIRDPRNRIVVISVSFNAPRAVTDRFNRLRNGDYVRIELERDGRVIPFFTLPVDALPEATAEKSN